MARKLTSFILVCLLLTVVAGEVMSQSWEKLPDMLRPRGEHANFVYQGNIYILGGIHDHRYGPYNIEKFDTQSHKWTDLGIWEGHRHHVTAGSSLHGNHIWICGGKPGDDPTGVKSVMVYDVKNHTWRDGPSLPRVVWGAPSVILNGKLHVIGGAESRKSTLNSHFVLDLSNEPGGWYKAASLPKPVVHAAAVPFQDEIWVIGGEIEHAHTGDKAWVQIYNPKTNSWRQGPSLPLARSHLEWSTFVSQGKIWSVNGVDSSKPDGFRGQDEIYVYEPQLKKWILWGRLPRNFTSAGAKIANDFLYVFGGGRDDWFDGTMKETYRVQIKINNE